jgi:2-dehydropantoate 2-reductase
MGKSIAVLSTGAIGSSIAADLTEAGHDVSLIDQWPAHVEAIRARGVKVTMSDLEVQVPVRAFHLCDVSSMQREFDIVCLTAKSHETRWMTEFIRPYLAADGVVVGMQNGMNNDAIADIVGRGRVIGCVLELAAEVFTPGLVRRNTTRKATWLAFGELDGAVTPRVQEIEAMMRCAARTSISTNIEGAKWTKLINSSMILAPFGVLGIESFEMTGEPAVARICCRLGRETLDVGVKAGYQLEPIFGMRPDEFWGSEDEVVHKLLIAITGHLGANATKTRGVVVQDFLKGRRSETDGLSGVVVRRGAEVGVPTPANAAIVEIARRIERGELEPGMHNLALIEQLAGG